MDQDSLLDTIQRLLALGSKNPNEHEARAALAKAQELLRRHNLTMAEVQAQAGNGPIYGPWRQETLVELEAVSGLHQGPCAIVHRHYFVRAIRERQILGRRRVGPIRITLFGRPENVAVARHVFEYLIETGRELYAAHRRRTGSRHAQAFWGGMFAAIDRRLTLDRQTQTAADSRALTVIAADLDDAARNAMGELRSARVRSVRDSGMDDYRAGLQAGQKVRIRDAVAGGNRPLLTRGMTHEGR